MARYTWNDVERELLRAAKLYSVEHYGLRSFKVGRYTVLYADRGDPYVPTVCAIARGDRYLGIERAAWGDLLQSLEIEEAD